MPKTVLISLAAVVALIVIVIFLGMRYLRADDDDDFDDGPVEDGRSRGRGTRYGRDQAHSRRDHDDLPDQRLRERPRAAVSAGAGGRSGRGASARPGGRAEAGGADGRRWRDQSIKETGRGPLPQRDSRPARSGGRPDRDPVGEPAAASARRGSGTSDRGGVRVIEELDGRAARTSTTTRDHDRDRTDGREGRDRWEGRDGREASDRRDARSGTGTRETFVADHDESDGRHVGRSVPKQDNGRKNGAAGDRDELLPAIKPRQGRAKRDTDGDWPSNEWDELSDVDYWAELASDKPLTSTPSAEQPSRPGRSDRGASRSDAEPGARGDRAQDRSGRQARKREPARQSDQPLAPAAARQQDRQPTGERGDLIGSGARGASIGRTEQLHAVPPGSGYGRDGLQTRHAEPADDDPLTSPSFPRIAADDGRSYRRARRTSADDSYPTDGVPGGPTQQHGYPLPTAGTSAVYPGTGADYARSTTDPYASIPAGGTVPSYPGGYPPSDGSAYGYPGAGGYAGPGDVGHGGYQAPGGTAAGGYPPPAAAGSGGYAGQTGVRGGYQPSQDPVGFRAPAADAGGYPSSGGYAGVGPSGHSQTAATSGYAFPADVTEYRSDLSDVPAGYPAYADPRSVSGPHAQPEPGYLTGDYGSGQPQGIHTSLPGGQPDSGYPAYPPSVPVGHGSPYPPPGGHAPGHSSGYQDPYPQAPYDPVGYQVPAAPQPGYAGADPYAVDPYGYSGYGGAGR